MVDTPFFDNRPGEWALQDEDIARAVLTTSIGQLCPLEGAQLSD